jgi:cytoskeleton protein RodZ
VAENETARAGLGERLTRARERRGLAVLLAAEKLHLEPRVIEALESENFDVLGAAVYVRGHLQRYAELLGENAAELQALYAGRPHAHATPDLTQVITERARSALPATRLGVWQGAVLTLVLVVVALIWWAMRSGPRSVPPPGGASPPALMREPAAPAPAGAVKTPTAATPAGGRGVGAAAGAGAAHETAPPVRAQRAAGPAASVPAATRTPAAAATAAPASTAAVPTARPASSKPAPAAAPAAAANAAHLVLRFKEDSWAEVYDATGATLYRDIATAGAVQTLSGVPPLRLVLGNAAGVSLSLDGRSVSLGPMLLATPNVQFSLDRGGRVAESP